MDDRKVYELARLKLAYQKQLYFIAGLICVTLIGFVLYIITVYNYNMSLLILAVVTVITGLIGIMTVDQKIKVISGKIKRL